MRGKLRSHARLVNDYHDDHHHMTIAKIGIMLALLLAGMPSRAFAQSSTVLMHRVGRALRTNDNLNGADVLQPSTRRNRFAR